MPAGRPGRFHELVDDPPSSATRPFSVAVTDCLLAAGGGPREFAAWPQQRQRRSGPRWSQCCPWPIPDQAQVGLVNQGGCFPASDPASPGPARWAARGAVHRKPAAANGLSARVDCQRPMRSRCWVTSLMLVSISAAPTTVMQSRHEAFRPLHQRMRRASDCFACCLTFFRPPEPAAVLTCPLQLRRACTQLRASWDRRTEPAPTGARAAAPL